jgi:hypothetical protein
MLYKPNFCCNCGEKIERLEWNLLTSRRFCVACSSEHKAHDVIPRAAVVAGALALMFGFGSLWTGSGRAEPKAPESVVGLKSSVPVADPVRSVEPSKADPLPASNAQTPEQARTASTTAASADDRNPGKYFCGALTKKGTPCSRNVKVKGQRCYQHEGRPEAPPTE